MRCLDRAVHDEQMPGEAAERVERLMDTGAYETRSRAEQWAAATGDEHYATAFAKIIGDPQRGHMLWTPDEQRAYAQVQNIRAALSTGAGNGGEMVPLTLEPAVMLTSDGSINPLRRIARVVQTATNAWQGVTSAGATAEWLPTEGTEAGDGAPGFESPIVPVYLGDVDVLFSYQVEQDAANFLPELQRVMVDAADQLQAEAFTTGAAGPVEPTGIVTALDAATPSLIVTGDGSEALMSADVFKIQNALPPRWSPRAQWMASLGVINAIRQFESSNGSVLFPELANGRLLGRAMNENSGMLAAPAVSATQDNYLAIYGDFSGFVIADRIGTTLEILPGYGAAAHRPTAQRHAFMTFRTGSDLVVPSFRMLNVATSA
jgi:HK97 family phage major capsid protein